MRSVVLQKEGDPLLPRLILSPIVPWTEMVIAEHSAGPSADVTEERGAQVGVEVDEEVGGQLEK